MHADNVALIIFVALFLYFIFATMVWARVNNYLTPPDLERNFIVLVDLPEIPEPAHTQRYPNMDNF